MTPRGLYFCAVETCKLAPEVWRPHDEKRKIGFCLKHAIERGLCKAPVPIVGAQKKKSFLQELLDEIAAAKESEPKPEIKNPPRYWWEDHPNQDPF